MFKCEICHDWYSRIEITKQWWNIARNDWKSLNSKDLPYYIAILAVLRETTKEIFYDEPTCKNHSIMEKDLRGYSLVANKNCKFIPVKKTQKDKWYGFYHTIRIFRNGAAHITDIQPMNPFFHNGMMISEDSTQDYYRYAPFPDLRKNEKGKKYIDSDLKKIHGFVRESILVDVRSPTSNIPSHRIHYEIYHVERGPFIDLLNNKMIELLKEVKSY